VQFPHFFYNLQHPVLQRNLAHDKKKDFFYISKTVNYFGGNMKDAIKNLIIVNERHYIYHLTPKGIQAKANLTVQFLKRKMAEYDQLQTKIEELDQEVQRLSELGLLSTTNVN
jgi:cell shape-determining protein MreC